MSKLIKYEILFIFFFIILFLSIGVTFGLLFLAGILQTALLVICFHIAFKHTGKPNYIVANRIIGGFFLLFLISFVMIEGVLLKTAHQSHQISDENPDAVIILGAGLKGSELSNTLKERLEKGRWFLEGHGDVPVVVSGGQGPGEHIAEAEAMGDYLIANGIQKDRIFYDKTSTTTYENIRNSTVILNEQGLQNKKIVIITSDYHIYRARKIGEEQGLNCIGLGSESPFFITANYMIREYFAVVNMLIH